MSTQISANRSVAKPAAQAAAAGKFRLVRHFMVASVIAFVLVGAAMILQERSQGRFFAEAQTAQGRLFAEAQQRFAAQQQEAAKADLVAIHEGGSVNVARLFANALWTRDFAPFTAKVQSIPVDADAGARIRAMPEFRVLDLRVSEAMRGSTVFKIKVYDLRGLTVYSSDHSQVGEDKSANAGWRQAAHGNPASKISHRDKFSAFEGVVNDRDLMETYLPVTAPGSDQIVGVMETYTDITPFLARIKSGAERTQAVAAADLERMRQAATENARASERNSILGIAIVAALLIALFVSLALVVRRAARIIAAQAHDRELMQSQLGQSEKMVALGQMVAGVAHQLNTPLAFTQSNVNMLIERLGEFEPAVNVARKLANLVRSTPGDSIVLTMGRAREQVAAIRCTSKDIETMREMLRDVLGGLEQMSELVVNMREFTRLDRASQASVDINQGLKTVSYMARSIIPNEIELIEHYGELPQIRCNPSQLNQVFLNLITNAAQAIQGRGSITVRTRPAGSWVQVQVSDTGAGIPPDVLPHIFESFYTTKPRGVGTGLGLSIAMEIVHEHGGHMEVETKVGEGTTFTIMLPVRRPEAARIAA